MIPKFDKVHNRFKLNGHHYDLEDLKEVGYSLIKEGSDNERVCGEFLMDWTNHRDSIMVKTSGSTGAPKAIELSKQAMVNSAIATGDYFNLEPGDTALHCLPNDFIAGKMMIVRAIVLGLELRIVAPSSLPIFDYLQPYDFAAMVPLQLKNCLKYTQNIKKIIVGGAPVHEKLKAQIKELKSTVYETYGMTETCTHVAVKNLSNEEQSFRALADVTFTTNKDNCLIIDAPHVNVASLVTNDVVKLHDNTNFEWLGRIDNVINTGGIKVFPEQIEAKLNAQLDQSFFISGLPDDTLGEKVILIIEGSESALDKELFQHLTKFEKPKEVLFVPKFARSSAGKILRDQILSAVQ